MSIDVSVIIPVYNSERYLPECIESLIRQTLQACEFIFINDGSTDRSLEILEKYQQCDERIKIYNQENQGVSAARNYGIQLSKGEYIGFVDSDDMIEVDYFNTLYQTAKQNICDLVLCNLKFSKGDSEIKYPFNTNELLDNQYIKQNIYPYFLKYDNLNSVCNKLYKKSIVDNYQIAFPKSIALGEDGLFNQRFLTYTKRFYYLDYAGYVYKEVIGSATRNIEKHDYFSRELLHFEQTIPEYNLWGMDNQEIEFLKFNKLINNVLNLCYMYLLPNNNMKFHKRYQYVSKMIKNPQLQQLVKKYSNHLLNDRSLYEKILLKLIQKRCMPGVCGVILYSQYRNKEL